MTDALRFGPFELRPRQRLLLRDGEPVVIGGRALDLLVALAEQRHRVVGKDELLDRCWPGLAVESNNIAVQVWALRRLLGTSAIATVPARGYQFTVAVEGDAGTPDVQPRAASEGDLPPPPLLPAQTTSLHGRADEMARLPALVRQHRLVSLLGPSGVGKTRLALGLVQASAMLRPAAVAIVDLAAVARPETVAEVVRHALGIASPGVHTPAPDWATALGNRPLLLVLDNCEHLRDAVAATVRQMLAQAPRLHVLATSQLPLGLAQEQRVRIAPLPVPEDDDLSQARQCAAVSLLEARVRALDSTFTFDEGGLVAALDICRQLDGLPLAIELAAVRVPLLGVHGVRARLADRLRLLATTPAHDAGRHATLREALAWSHALLDARERGLFRRLGVFRGGFSIELAQAIGREDDADEWAVLDLLGGLVDKSLVVLDATDPPRFRLLDSARIYALDQLREAGELGAMQERHARAIVSVAMQNFEARQDGRLSHDAANAGTRRELDNIRSALSWATGPGGNLSLAVSMVASAWPAMLFFGLHDECLHWMLSLEDRLEAHAPPPIVGFFLVGMGVIGQRSELSPARRMAVLRRADALLEALGADEYRLGALHGMAQIACRTGDAAAAVDLMTRARRLVGPAHPPAYDAGLATLHAIALALAGRPGEAHALHEATVQRCHAEGMDEFVFMVLCDLAELELLLGQAGAAARRQQVLVQRGRARRLHGHVMGPLLTNWCGALTAQGALAAAQAVAAEALHHMTLLGAAREGCQFYASLAAQRGRLAEAARLVGAGDAFRREVGETRLLNETAAREAALTMISARHGPTEIERWCAEGEALDTAALSAIVLQDA